MAVDRLPQFGARAKMIESEIFGEAADFMRQPDLVQAGQAVAIAAAKHEIGDGPHPQAVGLEHRHAEAVVRRGESLGLANAAHAEAGKGIGTHDGGARKARRDRANGLQRHDIAIRTRGGRGRRRRGAAAGESAARAPAPTRIELTANRAAKNLAIIFAL